MLMIYEFNFNYMCQNICALFLPKSVCYNNNYHFFFLKEKYNVDKMRHWGLWNFKLNKIFIQVNKS